MGLERFQGATPMWGPIVREWTPMTGDGPILGIDLGTTNSVGAILQGVEPQVVPNSEGSNKTPSVAAFLDGGKVVVGEIARRQAAANPDRTIFSVKRLMGRYYSELVESGEAQRFRLRTDEMDRVYFDIDGAGYTPQQISALILRKLKEGAEERCGEEISQAIITVPAYFDDLQRTATLEAGRIAGLDVLRLINEPTAAAMAYGLGRDSEELVAVYDFGGGTFDVSILDIDHKTIEVVNCAGDTYLGGDDLDQLLFEELRTRFEREHGVSLGSDAATLRRLTEAAEKAKCELSTLGQTQVSLPFLGYQNNSPVHLEAMVTREQFERLIEPIVRRTLEICAQALDEAGLSTKDLSKVILVGGSTRIPLVQDMVEDFFGLPPFKGVNPDEIVALGAATQGGVLRGALQEVVLLDVTPHAMGVEVKDGRMSVVIAKNTTIPVKETKTFTTTEDNQPFVNIHVLQGEGETAAENRSLGKFRLADFPPAAAGAPRIRVTFFITADGVLEVSAAELQSGKEQSLTISHSFLTEEEREQHDRGRRRPRRARRVRKAYEAEPAPVGTVLEAGADPAAQPATGGPEGRAWQDFDLLPNDPRFDESDSPRRNAVAVAIDARRTPYPMARNGKEKIGASESQTRTSVGKTVAAPGPSAAPGVGWTGLMRQAKDLLDRGREDTVARDCFQRARSEFEQHISRKPEDAQARLCLARLYLSSQMAEECRKTLSEAVQSDRESARAAFELYAVLLQRFPNYVQARREHADLAEKLGSLETAIQDLEAIQEREEAQPTAAKRLAELYRLRLEEAPDPPTQFKLVKVCLRLQDLEGAIAILESLVGVAGCEEQAARALGLCYWQTNRFDLAWQTLRRLRLDAELKDMLYRLGEEMESRDELTLARQVFHRLSSEDRTFRDVEGRFKKVDYRLRLRMDQMDQTVARGDLPKALEDPRFDLLEEINRGSMGIIYKARDKILDEIVALKVLNGSLAIDSDAVERFKQEARAAKRLAHPNIVRIHDMYEAGDKKWLSMEYIEGEDLKKLLGKEAPFPEDKVLGILRQILQALDYAHQLGVVHRDIKPANIMLTAGGALKITDFGIAKILTANEATRVRMLIVGTPLYMSPEQIEGGKVDARSDLYSLGITAYEMLFGEPPFCEGDIEYHHIHSRPPDLPETVSAPLREFVARCIQKDPAQRFQSSREALDFLANGA